MSEPASAGTSFTVRFRTNYFELVDALRAIGGAVPLTRLMHRVALGLFVLALMLFAAARVWEDLEVVLMITAAAALFVPLLVWSLSWLLPALFAWMLRKSPIWTGEQQVVFSDAGISGSTGSSGGFLRWEAITRVAESRRFLLYFISDRVGYFIPKRALPDESDVRLLLSMLRERAGKLSLSVAPMEPPSSFVTPAKVVSTFDVDASELNRAVWQATLRSRTTWLLYGLMLLFVAWNMGRLVVDQWNEGGWNAISLQLVLLGLAPLLIMLGGGPLVARYFMTRDKRSNPSMAGPQSIRLHDEGITTHGTLYSGEVRWSALPKVVETKEFFLFILSGLHALYLPKRTLGQAEVTLARELIVANMAGRAKVRAS